MIHNNPTKRIFKETRIHQAFLFSAPFFAGCLVVLVSALVQKEPYTDILPFLLISAAVFLIFYLPPRSVLEITKQGIKIKTCVGPVIFKTQEGNWSEVEKIKIRRSYYRYPRFYLIKVYTKHWRSKVINIDLLEGEGVKSYYNIKNMLLRYGMSHKHIISLLEQYWGRKFSRVSYFSKSAWEKFLLPSHPKDSSAGAWFLFLSAVVIGLALIAAVIAVLVFP